MQILRVLLADVDESSIPINSADIKQALMGYLQYCFMTNEGSWLFPGRSPGSKNR